MENAGKHSRRNRADREARYGLELARASSHIASMLRADSTRAAVLETANDFIREHDANDLPFFLDALAARLDARLTHDAASIVRQFAKSRPGRRARRRPPA
ncbi:MULTISPECIES: hypothetical protein [Burkholderia cepacia complex]|uniref:Uncharacterized protein n=1 Tax=Burkholderia pseudomultivorans TaxID=1207504 RepID=A0ABU2E1F4_9BURK|nr:MULTISPECIES: hypothetical protein [Burkholderia cepacia complex]MDN8068998.1 hypothetical protein [Burkholderia vietnamiensis]MDR8728270.1 hypothetical protein [Burkholderia pseudomultivorans]MDR8735238.1 hypothetical protein [Burkholderia pseudomultivorans]MDR8741386.1 hypothetical protein [Burkholderia pseudomultivorans]MDR8753660.1 hypothetical protein [Burkholderia pseudomultivorans]